MRFTPALFGLGLPALLLLIAGAVGQPRLPQVKAEVADQPAQPMKGKTHFTEQSFPPNGVMETAWKVEWDTMRRNGLVIKNAWFKRSPGHDWMQVVGDCRVAELFVPYHRGTPRYWDITGFQFALTRVSAADAGPFGKLHVSHNGDVLIPCVVEELKDRGVIWKDYQGVRRGHTLLLWGCIDAANYRYIIEYGFQDDGCITFRCGATGRNLGGSEFEPHMHNTFWRLDINLDDKDHNTVQLMERTEPLPTEKVKAQVVHNSFNEGKEGGVDWDAAKFTMLRIINTQKKNVRDQPYAYDLVPNRMGNSRHFRDEEACTQHDFWVTKARDGEMTYKNLPQYCNGEDIDDTDVVIWYSTPMFHEPRSEDGIMMTGANGRKEFVGCTQVAWSGFMLRPRDIFDRSPLYPYAEIGKGKGKGKGFNFKDKDK